MRPVGPVLGVVLVAFAISAAVAFRLEDRRTFVPPPDAEAESFGRALAMERADRALTHLSEDFRQQVTADDLRAHGRRISQGPGTVWEVSGKTDWVGGERAAATVTSRGRGGERRLKLFLRREKGLWRVAGIEPAG